VVFEAEATRRQYTHLGDPHRFRAMPYAVELDQIARRGESFDGSTLRRRLGIPEATTVVLCLGTFEPRKAQSSIVQAFSLVAEQHPDAWLCLVGDLGDSYSGAVREYVTRAGLWPRVVIRPMVDDPYEWLGVADVLVLASDIESLPRVVLEAMALGTPVVSTGVFGLADLIDDGRTPEERRRITDAASSMVRRNHKPEGYARDFVRLIEEALDSTTAPVRSVVGM
jgi:glycosyltransferase involved in cell wall biosynthesis